MPRAAAEVDASGCDRPGAWHANLVTLATLATLATLTTRAKLAILTSQVGFVRSLPVQAATADALAVSDGNEEWILQVARIEGSKNSKAASG